MIPAEYFAGLETLRDRLALSEATASRLFAKVGQTKMKAYGSRAFEALEAKAKAQQKAAENKEGSLAMEGAPLAQEVLGLLEYTTSARIMTTVDGRDVCSASLKGLFSDSGIKELYKQLLIEAFAAPGQSSNEKLFANLRKVGLTLGLDGAEQHEINNEVGELVYRQVVKEALQKGGLGEGETAFLDATRASLGLDDEQYEGLVQKIKLERINNLVEGIFAASEVAAVRVTKMRDEAVSYDIDLVEDAKVPRFRLEKMFAVEVAALIDDGDITSGDLGALEDVCESLHISEERAQELLELTVKGKTANNILEASSSFRLERQDEMREKLDAALRIAAITDVSQVDVSVSATNKAEMFMLYQAGALGTGAGGDGQEKMERLKQLLGLGDAAAA